MHTPDILAFSLVVFWARKSRVPGLKVSTILDNVAEDATYYFVLVFTSHFGFLMTLSLGRASVAVSQFSELRPMTFTACASRRQSKFSRPRKLSLPYLSRNHPHYVSFATTSGVLV